MIDLTPLHRALTKLKANEFDCPEGKINLLMWLGERAGRLVAEIERLRAVGQKAYDALDAKDYDGADDRLEHAAWRAQILENLQAAISGIFDRPPGAIDLKYGEITATNRQFHPGEPVFLLRSQDILAPTQVAEYAAACRDAGCTEEHCKGVLQAAEAMHKWQTENPGLVKRPGDPR